MVCMHTVTGSTFSDWTGGCEAGCCISPPERTCPYQAVLGHLEYLGRDKGRQRRQRGQVYQVLSFAPLSYLEDVVGVRSRPDPDHVFQVA